MVEYLKMNMLLTNALKRRMRHNGKILTLYEIVEQHNPVSKSVFMQTHSDHRIVLEYKKLAKPKAHYTLWSEDERGLEVPKVVYDLIQLPLKREVR